MTIKFANYIPQCRNIGDHVQIHALDLIYEQMGLSPEEIVHFTAEEVEQLCKGNDHYILPLVSANAFYHSLIKMLIEAGLDRYFTFIPLSIGQTRPDFLTEENLSKYRWIIDKFEMPIGCRDYDTALMYKNLGYQSYVNGCISNILPTRKPGSYDKVYLIDIPETVREYIPKELLDNAETLTQKLDDRIPAKQQFKICWERYEHLRDTASLIITVRYHIAVPCCAMGIPVIMVENNNQKHHWTFDVRFCALNPHIPFYTAEQWPNMSFSPENCIGSFEREKREMTELAISRIRNAEKIAWTAAALDNFYQPSKTRFWDILCENRDKNAELDQGFFLKTGGEFRYYFYGLSNQYVEKNRCALLEYMQRKYPKAEFLGFVDSRKTGIFLGKKILSPAEMRIDQSSYCLVSAYTANSAVKQLFEANGWEKDHLWEMPDTLIFSTYCL